MVSGDGPEGLWKYIRGNDDLDHHLIARNVQQFSHAGATPFRYTELGKELGHTGDSPMAHTAYDGTLEHEALSDSAIHAIVEQLCKHPAIEKILTPVATTEEFNYTFKCVSEKTASSFLGRGAHHNKSCTEGSKDDMADIQVEDGDSPARHMILAREM
jgi:hypothetical protein